MLNLTLNLILNLTLNLSLNLIFFILLFALAGVTEGGEASAEGVKGQEGHGGREVGVGEAP